MAPGAPAGSSPRFLAELGRTIRSRLRVVARACVDARHRPETTRHGKGRNISLHHHHSRLRVAKRDELYRCIVELERFLIENDDPRQESSTNATIVVPPIERPAHDA